MAGCCVHWLYFQPTSYFVFTIFLQSLVSGYPSDTQVESDCSTDGLFYIFRVTKMYRFNPRPFWLLSQDPLQSTPHKVTKWVIHQNEIWASHGWSRRDFREVGSYKLHCERSMRLGEGSGYKVLFSLTDGGSDDGTGQHVCIEIASRGPLIFQVRLSEVKKHSSPPSHGPVCFEDNMVDTGMTFVNFEDSSTGWNEYIESFAHFVPCPISGGYAITSWLDQSGHTKCDDPAIADPSGSGYEAEYTAGGKLYHLRVEDDCDHGTGIVFSEERGTSDCKNPFFGEIYKDEALRCFASWSDKSYTYAIALTDFPNSAYCIRVPAELTDKIQTYVFKDGICDFTSDILHSKEYVQMDLVRYSQTSVNARMSPSYTVIDRKIPHYLKGSWYKETEGLGDDHILITGHSINSTQLGVWQLLGPASCSVETHGLQDQGKFYYVTSRKQNGCQPRLALIWLMRFSKSVLGFQLSQSAILSHDTFNKTLHYPPANLCQDLHFGETNQILKDKYHVEAYAWNNLVSTDENAPLVDCDLGALRKMRITLPEGQSCTVGIKQDGTNTFVVMMQSCDRPVIGIKVGVPIEHQCMARFKGKHGWSSYLITRTPQEQTNFAKRQFACWLFSNEEPRGLVMPVGDCNDETLVQVSELKTKTALVKFYLVSKTVGKSSVTQASMLMLISVSILALILK